MILCYREHDKKVCCLGLTSLLLLPADQLPAEALGRVFKAALDLLVAYKDQVAGLSLSLSLSIYIYIYIIGDYTREGMHDIQCISTEPARPDNPTTTHIPSLTLDHNMTGHKACQA